MTEDKEQALIAKYPTIFRDCDKSEMESCMGRGLCVGDGWHDIIETLCAKIMAMPEADHCDFQAEQVKEKFGGLRFYHSGGTYEIGELVDEAEELSYKTCESCGSTEDVKVVGSWLKAECAECRKSAGCV